MDNKDLMDELSCDNAANKSGKAAEKLASKSGRFARQEAMNEVKANFFSILERINNATILM